MSGAGNPYEAPTGPSVTPPPPNQRWNVGQHVLLWSQVGLPFAPAVLLSRSILDVAHSVLRLSGVRRAALIMIAMIAIGGVFQAGLIHAQNRRRGKKSWGTNGDAILLLQLLVYLGFLIVPALICAFISIPMIVAVG